MFFSRSSDFFFQASLRQFTFKLPSSQKNRKYSYRNFSNKIHMNFSLMMTRKKGAINLKIKIFNNFKKIF